MEKKTKLYEKHDHILWPKAH